MSSLQHIGPLCLTYINDIWLRLILSCTSLLLFQQKNAIYLSQYSYLITSEIRKCIHHWVQYIWHRASRPVTCHWILASNILDSRYPWKLMWVSKNNFIFCNQVYVAVIWVMFCQIPWKYGARGLRRIYDYRRHWWWNKKVTKVHSWEKWAPNSVSLHKITATQNIFF